MSGLSAVSSYSSGEGVIAPSRTSINSLPDEMLALILGHTEGRDRAQCERVCKRWRRLYRGIPLLRRKIEEIAGKVEEIAQTIKRRTFLLRATGDDDYGRIQTLQDDKDKYRQALTDAVYALFRAVNLENSLDDRFKSLVDLAEKLPKAKRQVFGCIARGIAKAGHFALAIEAAKQASDDQYKNDAFVRVIKHWLETGNFHLALEVLNADEFTSEESKNWARYSIAEAAMKAGDFALAMQQVACMSEEGEEGLMLRDQAHGTIVKEAAKAGLLHMAIKEANAISSDYWKKGNSFLLIAEAAGELDLAVNMLSEASKYPCSMPLDKTRHAVIRKFVEGTDLAKMITQLGKIADKEVALAVVRDLIELNRASDAAEVKSSIASWPR